MDDLILENPESWILETLYKANRPDYETYRVYTCLARYITDNRQFIGITEEIIPNVLRFKPLTDLADDCLFSVAFFSPYIRKRCDRRGAPNVRYYAKTGQSAYTSIGYPAIAKNWNLWISHIDQHVKFNK